MAHEGIVLAKTADVHAAAAQARADAAHSLATTGNATADTALALARAKAQIVGYSATLTNTPASDVEQLVGLGLTVPLKPDRIYFIAAWGFEVQTATGDKAMMRLRHTIDGTAVTVASPLLKERLFWPTRSVWSSDREFFHLIRSATVPLTLKLQLTLIPLNAATGGRLFNEHGAIIAMFDVGPDMAATP